jgi:hypothetical protein
VRPDPGYEVLLETEEFQKMVTDRRKRDIVHQGGNGGSSDGATPELDRQLQRALECLKEQLAAQGPTAQAA